MSLKLMLFTACLIGVSASANAQDTTQNNLTEVVVTANKISQKQMATGKVVTVINAQQIQESSGRTISELLNTQAGVYINGANNSPGTNLDIYFRGAGSGKTLIVLDGVPVYDPSRIDNSFDLNGISLSMVERIEILKGGQSTLWGSDAIAGVIQIFTKKNSLKPFSANLNYALGTYTTENFNVGINGKKDKIGYSLRYNAQSSKGFSSAIDSIGTKNYDDDGFKQHNLGFTLDYDVFKNAQVSLFSNYSKYTNDIDAGAYVDDKDYSAENNNRINGLIYRHTIGKLKYQLSASYQTTERQYTDDSADISSSFYKYAHSNYTGKSLVFESFGSLVINKHISLVGGLQYLKNKTQQSYFSTDGFFPFSTTLSEDSAHTQQGAIYGSILFSNLSNVNLEIGSRLNFHSFYGNNATFTFNPSFRVDDFTKLFFNYSTAYKTPALYQLFDGYSGNRNLKPERSNNLEIGFETGTLNRSSTFRLVGFSRNISNLITSNSSFVYVNGEVQNDYGFEIEAKAQLNTWGSIATNLAYVDGEGTQDGLKVNNLYRIPNLIVNTELIIKPSKWITVKPSFKFVSNRNGSPYDAPPIKLAKYSLIDLYSSVQLLKRATLFLNCHNLTSQQYMDISGYNTKSFNFMTGFAIQL